MKLLLALFSVLFFLFGCSDSVDKGDGDGGEFTPSDTTIDAVSSASGKFKLNGGVIYDDSLVIDFWYAYNNGYSWALVINQLNDTIICDTLSQTHLDYPDYSENSHTLKPLKPATSYRLIMDGIYHGQDTWPLDTVSFTTRSAE
jgi:hypothetical protein